MITKTQRRHTDPLIAREVTVRTEGPSNPHLVISFQLYNPNPNACCILKSQVECKFRKLNVSTIDIARGDFLTVGYAPTLHSIFEAEDTQPAKVYIPLTHEHLLKIEDLRAGGEIDYLIQLYIIVAPVIDGEQRTLGAPWEEQVSRSGSEFFEGTISQSDWLKYLVTLGWDETLLLEFPVGRMKNVPPQALQLFQDAQDHYRRGDWRKTLATCNEIFEALAWTKTNPDADQADLKKLREFFDETLKGDRLNTTIESFRKFLHLGRHQQGPGLDIGRADAILALHCTAGIIRHIGLQ